MDILDNSGIYCIYFDSEPDKYYIGCSTNLRKRINNHKSSMQRDVHDNYKIQSLYNKYGLPNIEILEYCTRDSIFDKEVEYISEFDSFNNGLNLTVGGNGRLFGEDNPAALHSKEQYVQVVKYLALTDKRYSEISSLTKVSIYIIKHIASLSAHTYLQEDLPEEYKLLEAKLHNRPDNSAKSKGITYPKVVSPTGRVYNIENLTQFAKEHGLQAQNLHKVVTGQRKAHLGWKLNGS